MAKLRHGNSTMAGPDDTSQMEPKIYALNDITPDMKNWTARVCVLNKTGPRISSQSTPIKFQKLLLGDEQGNKVEAMLYRSDVDLLKNSLQSDETYLISNALVQPVKQGFENPLVNNKYQWIIGARTAVLLTEKKDFVFSALTPVLTHYNQFHKFIGTRGLISTVAVIFSKHDQRCVSSRGRENTLREYVAIDEAFTPFVITFWNDAVPEDTYSMLDCIHNQHVIAALNFTVTKFHDIFFACYIFSMMEQCIREMLAYMNRLSNPPTWSGSATDIAECMRALEYYKPESVYGLEQRVCDEISLHIPEIRNIFRYERGTQEKRDNSAALNSLFEYAEYELPFQCPPNSPHEISADTDLTVLNPRGQIRRLCSKFYSRVRARKILYYTGDQWNQPAGYLESSSVYKPLLEDYDTIDRQRTLERLIDNFYYIPNLSDYVMKREIGVRFPKVRAQKY
ncbi:hypothetical protein OROMI_025000 [Orobanche minor]